MTPPTEAMTMPEPPPGDLWAELRGALRGVQHDYTSGPVGRAVLLLAVPMVLETLAESVFAVVDVFFVSKLGAWAIATVGITETILHLVYTVAMGLSIGVTAMVSRAPRCRRSSSASESPRRSAWWAGCSRRTSSA